MGWSLTNIFGGKEKPKDESKEILEDGWQFCSKPGTMNQPGSVFRIDENKIRKEAGLFEIKTETAEEVFGHSVQSRNLSAGIMSRLIGITGLKLNLSLSHNNSFDLEFS